MKRELENRGLETILPYIEVYGHWNKRRNKIGDRTLYVLKVSSQIRYPISVTGRRDSNLDLWKKF
jgi:hypothetical protein